MAANLCASIKLFNDETKVALAYSESAISRLNEAELSMFDEKILVDKSMYKLYKHLKLVYVSRKKI